jgi:hypothetical protein
MWTVSITRRHSAVVLVALAAVVACAGPDRSTGVASHHATAANAAVSEDNPNSAAGDDQGIINGYLDGETMALRYTRLYFCENPPASAAPSGCEVGAGPTIAPRSGPIPKIYALAPAGFTPDPSTVHCKGGSVCLNHPPMLDLSRLGLPTNVFAPAHSHVLEGRQAGWHLTVNIRVPTLAAWNEIAAAKSIETVRQLQRDGRVGPDIPTNVYFFIEVQLAKPE